MPVPTFLAQDSIINTTPTGGDSVLTIPSFALAAETTIIIIALLIWGAGSFNGGEHDGLNFEIAHSAENGEAKSYILYLVNPNMVEADINISIKNEITTSKAVAVCFKDIDLVDPINAIAEYAFDVSEGISTNITTTSEDCLVIDALSAGEGFDLVAFQEQLLADVDSSIGASQYTVKDVAGVQAMDWSWAGEVQAAHTLVAFNPLADDVVAARKSDMFQGM
jgi:hypothetical protein